MPHRRIFKPPWYLTSAVRTLFMIEYTPIRRGELYGDIDLVIVSLDGRQMGSGS